MAGPKDMTDGQAMGAAAGATATPERNDKRHAREHDLDEAKTPDQLSGETAKGARNNETRNRNRQGQ